MPPCCRSGPQLARDQSPRRRVWRRGVDRGARLLLPIPPPDDRARGQRDLDFAGDVTHTATDSSGLELFDSGNVPPGSGPSLSFTYEAAGVYHFVCTPHAGMAGRVSVPMRATPSTGRNHDFFTLVWASSAATGDHVYDVQVKRPGSAWSTWRSGATIRKESFEPWKTGRDRFRARMRDAATDGSSRWSPVSSISVG